MAPDIDPSTTDCPPMDSQKHVQDNLQQASPTMNMMNDSLALRSLAPRKASTMRNQELDLSPTNPNHSSIRDAISVDEDADSQSDASTSDDPIVGNDLGDREGKEQVFANW
jgi:hypothetical protein